MASGIGEALGVGTGACRWPGDQGASWGQCVVSLLVLMMVDVGGVDDGGGGDVGCERVMDEVD